MAEWHITTADALADETVGLSTELCDQANRKVNRCLILANRDPESAELLADLGLTAADLKDVALAWAYFLAYSGQVVGEKSDAAEKAKVKKELFEDLWGEVELLAVSMPFNIPMQRG